MPANHLEQVIFNLGAQLGEHLLAGFNAAVSRNTLAAPRSLDPGRRPSSACVVPGCGSPSKSTNLCGKHYQKARRNALDGNHLTAEQMEILSLDGRALRFSRRADSAAKVTLARKAGTGSSPEGCIVPRCTGVAASAHLCPRHYQKSRRSGFKGKKLSEDQLQFLAKDGRSLRAAAADASRGSTKSR